MKYAEFLKGRSRWFRRTRIESANGRIITDRTAINLTAATVRIAENRTERDLIREMGPHHVMKNMVDLEDLIELRWSKPEGSKLSVRVQLLRTGEGIEYLCVHSNQEAWYAVAVLETANDPTLISSFFSVCRSHDRQGFGYCASQGPPDRFINHRPDIISGPAAIAVYGWWLRWAIARTRRSSGTGSLVGGFWDTPVRHGLPLKSQEAASLKSGLMLCYTERQNRRARNRRPGFLSLSSDRPSRATPADQIALLRSRTRFLDQSQEEAALSLLKALRSMGDTKESIGILERLGRMTQSAETRAYYLARIGGILEEILDFELAVNSYGQALALEPKDKPNWYFLHNNMGYCLNQLRRYQDTEWYCRAAIGIDNKRHNAHKNLGVALQFQGRLAEAVCEYIQAIRVNAADPRALKHLEELASAHPELVAEIPNLRDVILDCRRAVRRQSGGYEETLPDKNRDRDFNQDSDF